MMIIAASTLLLLSVFCFYIVTRKIEFKAKGLMVLAVERARVSRGLGALFGIAGTGILVTGMGKVAGVVTALLIWTVIASLALLFIPFNKVKVLHMLLFCISLWLIDIIF